MASSSNVSTLSSLPIGNNTTNDADQGSKKNAFQDVNPQKLDEITLPNPMDPPPRAEKPPSQEEFKKLKPNPSQDDWNSYQNEFDKRNIWITYEKEREEVEAMASSVGTENSFLDGQNFLNSDEAAADWVDEMAQVLRTAADLEKRREAYSYLLQQYSDHRHPDLKKVCEHNTRRLIEWAQSGYKSEIPKTEFFSLVIKDGKEEQVITDTPSRQPDHWSKSKRRVESTSDEKIPEQTPLTLPPEDSMATVRGLWERGNAPLTEIMKAPPKIRGELGQQLKQINKEIDKLKEDYIRASKADASEIPDLKIPTVMVVEMIVECTERSIRNNNDTDMSTDPEIQNAVSTIKEYVTRAGQGTVWTQNIEEAIGSFTTRARELGADSLEKLHAREEFWDADLASWVREHYMSSSPGTGSNQELRAPEEEPRSNRMSIDSASGSGAQLASQEPRAETVPDRDTSAAHTAPCPSGAENQQSARTSTFPDAVKVDIDPGYVDDEGQKRKIEGYAKAGGGNSLLIRMNEEEDIPAKCHLTAAGPFGHGTLTAYKASANARHIEGWTDCETLKTREITDLNCTFIAVQRDTCSRAIIGGRFDGDARGVEHHYCRTQLNRAFGSRCVDGWIRKIWSDAYVKRESEFASHQNDETYANFRQAKPLERPTTRPRRSNRSRKGDSENEGDGPLDQNDGIYDNDDPSGFVVPDSIASSSTSKLRKGDESQRGGDYFNAAFVVPGSKSGPSPQATNQQMEGFKTTIMEHVDKRIEQQIKVFEGGMQARFNNMETMMTTMMAKLGVV